MVIAIIGLVVAVVILWINLKSHQRALIVVAYQHNKLIERMLQKGALEYAEAQKLKIVRIK
jgi:hypothetical protein